MRFGTAAHEIAEHYLLTGTVPEEHSLEKQAFLAGFWRLPAPGTCQVEEQIQFDFEGVPFCGVIDAIHREECLKIDHKFVGDDRYILSPTTLVTDPQAVLYTLAPPVFENTRLRWVYYFKKRRGSTAVEATLLYSDAADICRRLYLPRAREMRDYMQLLEQHAGESARDLIQLIPGRESACYSYGRMCAHSDCSH